METHRVRLSWQSSKLVPAWSVIANIQSSAACTERNRAEGCSVSSRQQASSIMGRGLAHISPTRVKQLVRDTIPRGCLRNLEEVRSGHAEVRQEGRVIVLGDARGVGSAAECHDTPSRPRRRAEGHVRSTSLFPGK